MNTPADELRKLIMAALDNAHHTHPCPVTGDTYWTGCYHPGGGGPACHSNRRADAVLAAFPAPALVVARQLLAQQPTAAAARPAETEWVVETLWHDGDWRRYNPARATRNEAEQDYARAADQDADHQYRIVRVTTTTTVEPAPAVTEEATR